MSELDTPANCRLCGEDARLISFDGNHFVRVRRASKCKRKYGICKTEIHAEPAPAVAEWNERQKLEHEK